MAGLIAHIRSSVSGAVVRLLGVAFSLFLTFVLSLFFYGAFYYSYIPPAYYELPLHFARLVPAAGAAFSKASLSQQQQQQPEGVPAPTKATPVAADYLYDGDSGFGHRTGMVTLTAELDAFVGDPAAGGMPEPLFLPGHAYSVSVELQLPESEGNVDLGTFVLAARAYDRQGTLLHASHRMLRLRYRSALLRVVDSLVFAPLYLFGEREQKQTLGVTLFDAYLENAYKPTARLVLELSDERVELYAARLHVRVAFVGLRYWMFYWPLCSAVVGVASFEGLLLIVLVSSWLARLRVRRGTVPVDTQIASATNLPLVGAAESVSSASAVADGLPVPDIAAYSRGGDWNGDDCDDSRTKGIRGGRRLSSVDDSCQRNGVADGSEEPLDSASAHDEGLRRRRHQMR